MKRTTLQAQIKNWALLVRTKVDISTRVDQQSRVLRHNLPEPPQESHTHPHISVTPWNSRKLMCGAWTEKVYGIPNAQVELTRKGIMTTRPPLPPLSRETAIQKVRLAEDGWDSRDPDKRANSYPSGPISAWQDQSRRKSPYLLSNN